MCLARYLIPIAEPRLMHLDDAAVPALLDHARGDAIAAIEELRALRDEGDAAGEGIPALAALGPWWGWFLDESGADPTDLDRSGASGVLARALQGGRAIGVDPGGPTARYLWADEVRAVAAELAGVVRERDELLGCLHGSTPAEPPRETLFGGEVRRGEDLDGAEFDELVTGLEVLAAFYDIVARRGDGLLIATAPVDRDAH